MVSVSFPALQNPVQERNLIELLGSTKRRADLIVIFGIIGLLIGSLYVLMVPRKYESQALIALNTNEQNFGSVPNMPGNAILQPPVESIVLSQVEILQSRDLAENVLGDLELEKDRAFWEHSSKPVKPFAIHQKALTLITDHLEVRPVGRSLVMEIRYRHINPEIATKVVNRIAELYQEQQVKEKIENAKRTSIELQARLDILGKKLRESAKAVEEYSAKEDLVDGAKAEVTSQQISELSTQLVSAQAEEAGIKARQAQIQEVISNKKPADSLTEVMQSHMVELLKNDETTLLSQLAHLQSKYGAKHPKILALQAELSEVRNKKHGEITRVTQNIDNEIIAVQAKIELLQNKLKELEEKRRRENHAAIGLKELQREADANRVLYETFLNRYKENKMLGDLQQPDTKIISAARIPVRKAGTSPILIIMALSFMGTITGFFIVLLLEQLEMTIRDPEEITNMTGIENLGIIPDVDQVSADNVLGYTTEYPYSSITEALRSFCIRLLGRIERKPCIISLTSCFEDENKTKISLWVARLIARSGLRVLLIDVDLRHPNLAQYFDLDTQYPVTDIFLQKRTESQFLFADKEIPYLSVMTGTESPAHDIAALSKQSINAVFERLKKSFDLILIDNSPSSIAESRLFNNIADYTVLSVRLNCDPLKKVCNTVSQSGRDKDNLIGLIFLDERSTI